MKTIVIMLAVLGLGWMYLNRDTLFTSPSQSDVCAEWEGKLDDPDLNLSYQERARAVANGCL